MLQSQTPCPDFTNTEDFPIYGTKAWSSDSLGSSKLPIPESDPTSSQALRDSFRAGTSIESDNLLTIKDNSNLSTAVKATKRKRRTEDTIVPEHERCKIQDTVKEHEAKLSRDSEENHKQTSKSRWNYPCFYCGHKMCCYCQRECKVWWCCYCKEYSVPQLL